jgi:serine/threonine protein kinase
MGSVWVADHLGLQARVAVKFVDESLGSDQGILARFAREAAAAAKMRSPHVVQILDYGSIDGRIPYIVMELLEGESLGDRVARVGRISVNEAVSIVQQACKALGKAHTLGIIHRDIKPDNLFLSDADGDLFVKVLDFGIAKVESFDSADLTSTGTTVGTPSYASPEQLLSAKSATVSMDLWAVAATAYRSLTGALPFTGETFAALCLAITRGVFTPPTKLAPDLPLALDAWFARALDVSPENRFATARELAEQFAVAAGVSRVSISVPGSLPQSGPHPFSEPRPGSDSGSRPRTETAYAAGPEDSSPRQRGQSATGVSIGGASMTNGEHRPRSNTGKLVAAAAIGLVVVASGIIALTRSGDAPAASTSPTSAPPVPATPPPAAMPAPAATTKTEAIPVVTPSEPTRPPAPDTVPDPQAPELKPPVESVPSARRITLPPAKPPSRKPPTTSGPSKPQAPAGGGTDYGF